MLVIGKVKSLSMVNAKSVINVRWLDSIEHFVFKGLTTSNVCSQAFMLK